MRQNAVVRDRDKHAPKKARLRIGAVGGSIMSFEIERKFLVASGDWQKLAVSSIRIRQAYLASEGSLSIRVRI
jgi:hypothetical protein